MRTLNISPGQKNIPRAAVEMNSGRNHAGFEVSFSLKESDNLMRFPIMHTLKQNMK